MKPSCSCVEVRNELASLIAKMEKIVTPHAFYQDRVPRAVGKCDFTFPDGDYCGEAEETVPHLAAKFLQIKNQANALENKLETLSSVLSATKSFGQGKLADNQAIRNDLNKCLAYIVHQAEHFNRDCIVCANHKKTIDPIIARWYVDETKDPIAAMEAAEMAEEERRSRRREEEQKAYDFVKD